MFLSFLRVLVATASFCVLLPGALPAQSQPAGASIPPPAADRQQKVLEALLAVGVQVPQNGPPAPTFLSLVGEMKRWAPLPDPPPPAPPPSKQLPNLDTLIGDTFPNRWERWGRFHQFKAEAQEQQRTVLAYPTATATTAVPILNPDHVLFKYTVTTKASEFFPTTQDVADQIKAFTDAGGTHVIKDTKVLCKLQDSHSKQLNSAEEIASCLSKTRKRDIFYRFLSGFNGTFSYSDNPQVVQNILIPTGTAEAQQNRLFSGEVMFDPTNVFLSGTDWKNLSAVNAVYDDSVQMAVKKKLPKQCEDLGDETYYPSTECLERVS